MIVILLISTPLNAIDRDPKGRISSWAGWAPHTHPGLDPIPAFAEAPSGRRACQCQAKDRLMPDTNMLRVNCAVDLFGSYSASTPLFIVRS